MSKLDNKKIPKKILNNVKDLINKSKWPECILLVNDLLNEYPRSHELHTSKGICFSFLRKFDQAKDCLDAAKEFGCNEVEYKANIAELNSTIGNYHFNRDEFEESLESFLKSLDGSRNPSMHLSNIGNVLLKLGRREEANDYYMKSIKSDSKNATAYCNLANSLIETKEFELALKPAENCAKLDDIQPFYIITLGRVLSGLKRHDDALKVFNKLKMIAPKAPTSYYFICSTLLKLKKYREIIDLLSSVTDLIKNHANLLNILGIAYLEINEVDKSIDNFNAAKIADPSYSDSYLNLSKAYKEKGNHKESQIEYDKYQRNMK
tara:strand:- start:220 stop:1182 length:963 start_codon:yes stop_codon:yes gene_type:complete